MIEAPDIAIDELVWHGCYDGSWRDLMTPEAFAHPAKFSPGLIGRIYQHGLAAGWWRVGDTIGDPFGGVAGGGIYAGYHGLNWIGVELEERFVALGNANLALHGTRWLAGGHATRVTLTQGDSRRFAEIVGACDAIVTSPPFVDSLANAANPPETKVIRPFLPAAEDVARYLRSRRAESKLSQRDCDVHLGTTTLYSWYEGRPAGTQLPTPDHWLKLKTLLDLDDRYDRALLTVETVQATGRLTTGKTGHAKTDHYGTTEGQIGALDAGEVDAVVTSPPFGDEQPCASQTRAKRDYQAFTRGDGVKRDQEQRSDGNIATLGAGETYWQAMHVVYGQCLAALRPGGVMAVVVKDYVKAKRRVPLCDQTLRLLTHLGFEPVARVRAMLVKERRSDGFWQEHVERTERKSFFRRLAEKKGSPRIDWEEVLVVRAPARRQAVTP